MRVSYGISRAKKNRKKKFVPFPQTTKSHERHALIPSQAPHHPPHYRHPDPLPNRHPLPRCPLALPRLLKPIQHHRPHFTSPLPPPHAPHLAPPSKRHNRPPRLNLPLLSLPPLTQPLPGRSCTHPRLPSHPIKPGRYPKKRRTLHVIRRPQQ